MDISYVDTSKKNAVFDAVTNVDNDKNNDLFHKKWDEEMIRNAKDNKPVVEMWASQMAKCCMGQPVLFIANGPSMRKNIDKIRELSKSMMSICVDRAYNFCVEHDLRPDIVIAADSRARPIHGFDRPIILPVTMSKAFVDKWAAWKLFYIVSPTIDEVRELYKDSNPFYMAGGGNVSSIMLRFALEVCGVSKVVFTGHDFSTIDTVDAGDISESPMVFKRSKSGRQIFARANLISFMKWTHDSITSVAGHNDIEFIKLKDEDTLFGYDEKGNPIEGLKHLTSKEIICHLKEGDHRNLQKKQSKMQSKKKS